MKKIVFLGDSITDAEHNFGVDKAGLGNGYVSIIAEKLYALEEDIQIINRGHDGFTVQGLRKRLLQDCIMQKPDVVSILIGCNDVGIMMNTGKTLEEQHFLEEYEMLIDEIQNFTSAEIVCMAPFIFPWPQKYENWIPHILQIEENIHEVSEKKKTRFVALHKLLQGAAEQYGYSAVTIDGIHLTRFGAEIVAKKWLGTGII